MNALDKAIRDSLSKEDAEFLEGLDQEPGAMRQIAGIFAGPLQWVHWTLLVAAVLIGIVGVYAGWRFAVSAELQPLAHWGGITALCLVILAVVRLIFFMQMHTNRVLREIKRLELQVALLASRLGR
jgi:amino acid transporter